MATLCVIPYFFMRFSKGLLQKWVPPSLMIAQQKPNLAKICSYKNLITTLWSLALVGIALSHLDIYATLTRMY